MRIGSLHLHILRVRTTAPEREKVQFQVSKLIFWIVNTAAMILNGTSATVECFRPFELGENRKFRTSFCSVVLVDLEEVFEKEKKLPGKRRLEKLKQSAIIIRNELKSNKYFHI